MVHLEAQVQVRDTAIEKLKVEAAPVAGFRDLEEIARRLENNLYGLFVGEPTEDEEPDDAVHTTIDAVVVPPQRDIEGAELASDVARCNAEDRLARYCDALDMVSKNFVKNSTTTIDSRDSRNEWRNGYLQLSRLLERVEARVVSDINPAHASG